MFVRNSVPKKKKEREREKGEKQWKRNERYKKFL